MAGRWIAGLAAVLLLGSLARADDGQQMAAAQQSAPRPLAHFVMPTADPARGRELFVAKGCVACHAINEIGGTSAPPLDVEALPEAIDPSDFIARLWRGAEAMIFMQQQSLGEQLDFTGQELADIIAFAHDPEEQRRFAEGDVPPQYRRRIRTEAAPGWRE